MFLKLTIYAALIIAATFISIRQAPEQGASPERLFWTAVAITCFLLVFKAVPLFFRRLGLPEPPQPDWERILRAHKPKWSAAKVEKLNRLAVDGEHLEVMGNRLGVMPAVVESKMISLGIYPVYAKARTTKIQEETGCIRKRTSRSSSS